jgi:tRNA nucleotidyltransferase (CCA-adding enzyme)
MFWYIVGAKELIPLKKWVGPPLREKERVGSFKKKHKKTFVEKGRVCTSVKRSYVKAEKLVLDVLKDPLLKARVKKINLKLP